MSTISPRVSPEAPSEFLEQQAVEQRRRLHNTVEELSQQVRATVKEKLDVRRRAREYAFPAAGSAALFSMIVGYGIAGVFKHIFR